MAIEPLPPIARREMVIAHAIISIPALALLGIFLAAWGTGSHALHVLFIIWYGVVWVVATSVIFIRRSRLRAVDAAWALRFQKLALHDDLTGLFNRCYFDAALRRALREAREANESLSLALIDLNGFKVINDTFGHAAGDAAIRLAAGTVTAAAGPTAIVARVGGDEFAALLPGVLPGDARAFRARLMAAFDARPFTFEGSDPLHISAAVGLATLLDGQTAEDMLREADRALYASKAHLSSPALLRTAS